MKKLLILSALFPALSSAGGGELDTLIKKLESKGVLSKKDIKDIKKAPHLKIKLRLQPRLDLGDIYEEGGSYKSKSDFYIRRARIEISKKWKNLPAGKALKVNITLEMDKGERDYDYKKAEKKHSGFEVGVLYAYADWKIRDELSILLGKKKKPYSRVSLTSSSRQLLIERPVSTEDAKKWLGDYYGNQIMLHGKIAKGIFRYMFAVADGSTVEKKNKTKGEFVRSDTKVGNLYAVRVEFSPPGMVEKKKDDTGIGEKNKGNVVSFGLSYAQNRNFDVDTVSDNSESYDVTNEKAILWGADLFGRFGAGPGIVTAQAEYIKMKYDKLGKEERGWYVQGGYLIKTPLGGLEPAFRYENIDFPKSSKPDEKVITAGFNHYLKSHKVKWSYNVLLIDKEGDENRTVHQLQAQLYF